MKYTPQIPALLAASRTGRGVGQVWGVVDRAPYTQVPQEPDGVSSLSTSDGKKWESARLQAEVYDCYAICSALICGFSSGNAYVFGRDLRQELDTRAEVVVTMLHQWSIRLCSSMGIYAMMIFMLCALYARTALAKEGSTGLRLLEEFVRRTAGVRMHAFYAMYGSGLMFSLSIALSSFYSFDQLWAVATGAVLLVVFLATAYETRKVCKVASALLFLDDFPAEGAHATDSDQDQPERDSVSGLERSVDSRWI